MSITSSDLEHSIELFLKALSWNEPSFNRTLESKAHQMVNSIANSQLSEVYEEVQLLEITLELENLMRMFRAEFDCIYADLEMGIYPPFVRKVEQLRVSKSLGEYHALIVTLLKLILFRVSNSDDSTFIWEQVNQFVLRFLEQFEHEGDSMPSFHDKTEVKIESKIDKIIQEQLDITLDL